MTVAPQEHAAENVSLPARQPKNMTEKVDFLGTQQMMRTNKERTRMMEGAQRNNRRVAFREREPALLAVP